ncbi:radical SAM protein [Dyadobacter sp. CY261]|uniref:radical SAM/SPASM domain-containing protein n=1 Tax=Dyadobacter sp. CY261 TaxID=2907203 RepID=UPI001F1C00C7|nr:radical SAM protein [Dyadobacter sp. CY261]MCF0072476.1 radical SAM protein [Dyadobacter sp. CY261]
MFIPTKSAGLLTRKIDGSHYVVNCFYPDSLRVLTPLQYTIVSAIDGVSNAACLAKRFNVDELLLRSFLTSLADNELITFDRRYSLPARPERLRSLNFWIHTTNKCNLSCSYCYISTLQSTGGMQTDVQEQLLKKLVDTAKQRGIEKVNLRLAGGEPLIHFRSWRDFIGDAMSTLRVVQCELNVSFLTNLTVLNDEIISFATENNIGFGVSLDGLNQYHDQTRTFASGEGAFARTERNLLRLVANKIQVSVSTVITNENLPGLPDLTRFLVDLDIPFRFSIVKGQSIDAELLEHGLNESFTIMEDAIRRGWKFSRRHQFCDLKPTELGFQTCASGYSGGAIYVDGNLKYCHVHFGDESRKSLSIFDEELDLVDMIEEVSHGEDIRSEDCKRCKYRSICTSGCPVYRVNGKDPQCSIYHKFIPRIYDLLAMERLKVLRDCRIM